MFLRLGAKNKPSRRLEDGLSRFPGVAKGVHSEYRGTSRDRALKLHCRDETKNQFCWFQLEPAQVSALDNGYRLGSLEINLCGFAYDRERIR